MDSMIHPHPLPPPSRGRGLSHIFMVRACLQQVGVMNLSCKIYLILPLYLRLLKRKLEPPIVVFSEKEGQLMIHYMLDGMG